MYKLWRYVPKKLQVLSIKPFKSREEAQEFLEKNMYPTEQVYWEIAKID